MTTTLDGIHFGEQLHLQSWRDTLVEAHGHDARSNYAERFWLPVLGPSAMWFLRLCARELESSPEGCDLDVTDVARRLGLGERAGRHGPFLRTIGRTIDFEMATLAGSGSLAVRRLLPPLSRRHLLRLPAGLRAEHDAQSASDWTANQRARGTRLALSLLQLGESDLDAERQLVEWRFHPAIASQCVKAARRDLEQADGEPIPAHVLEKPGALLRSTPTLLMGSAHR